MWACTAVGKSELVRKKKERKKERKRLERKMLVWFPFPFQLLNKLNLRLPQIAVKDEEQKTLSFSFLLKTFASQVWILWNAEAKSKTQASVAQAQEQEEQPGCLNRRQKVSLSPPYWESTSLDSLWWRTWWDIRNIYTRHSSCIGRDMGKEIKAMSESRWSYDFLDPEN